MTTTSAARGPSGTGHPLPRVVAASLFRLAASSEFLSRVVLELGGTVSRLIDSDWLSARAFNVASGVAWPDVELRPRKTMIGAETAVMMRPHPGEFDLESLFSRRLSYEPEVFRTISEVMPAYDAIVEVGANVGVYTVFLAARARRGQRIISLEPSAEAFRRLQDNLRLNHSAQAEAEVTVLNAALGAQAGIRSFYEPADHLTNGSLDREFAARFSDSVRETKVLCLGAAELKALIDGCSRTLIKLDCEGAEPMILAGLEPELARIRPDLIVEVTEATASALNGIALLADRYERFLITDQGLARFDRFEPSARFRDWFLKARPV